MPNPEKSCSDVQHVLVTNMALFLSEARALMGVHSLGKARKAFSGYFGCWKVQLDSYIGE